MTDGLASRRDAWVSSRPRAERARQVADVVRQQITAGAFPDRTLPDERILGQQLGASRNAVREALGLLREEGLIARRRGVGTRIVAPKYGHGLDRLAGLAEALTGHGSVSNEVRAVHPVRHAPTAIADRLGITPPHDGAVYIERLRRLGGLPLSLDTTYLVEDIGRPLLDRDLTGQDLFDLIEETAGVRLGRAEVAVHAVAADPDTAALLDIPSGAAVFAIERLTRLVDGRAVDVESIHIRADRLTLHTTLYRVPDSDASGSRTTDHRTHR
ncbi:MAG TPA: GntR family transcriptional regulator [Mycobacteriales bacterium]|jgi:GntR family transcriptional regulator|nr:GntR family transcriptional regulator [Mycobacteriales bacterium]